MGKLAGLLLGATLIALFGVVHAAEPLKVIRVGVASIGVGGKPITGGSVASLVNTKGLLDEEFRKDSIRIEWNFFKGAGPAVNEALANGQLDFAFQGDLPAILAKAGGLKTRVIAGTDKDTPTYLAVPADSPAKSIDDLKGKKVAIFKGTNLQLVAIKAYQELGLGERDFKVINMDAATTQTALVSKDIDAAWFGPEIHALVAKGVARIVYSSKGQPAWLVRQSHALVTEDFARQHPRQVQRFVNVLLKEAAWAADERRRDEILKLWARSGVPYESFSRDWEGDLLKVRGSPLLDEFMVEHYREAMAASLKYKLIRKGFDLDAWFEPKYVRQGIRDLKLEKVWRERDASGSPRAGER